MNQVRCVGETETPTQRLSLIKALSNVTGTVIDMLISHKSLIEVGSLLAGTGTSK